MTKISTVEEREGVFLSEKEIEAAIERYATMPIEEIDAELRADGIDPQAIIDEVRELMKEARGEEAVASARS